MNTDDAGVVADLHCFNDWIDDVEELHAIRRQVYRDHYGNDQTGAERLVVKHVPDVQEQT